MPWKADTERSKNDSTRKSPLGNHHPNNGLRQERPVGAGLGSAPGRSRAAPRRALVTQTGKTGSTVLTQWPGQRPQKPAKWTRGPRRDALRTQGTVGSTPKASWELTAREGHQNIPAEGRFTKQLPVLLQTSLSGNRDQEASQRQGDAGT